MRRGWTDLPSLSGRDPRWCRRAAWCWMIESAHWQDGIISLRGATIHLKRGQFTHSLRFMAKLWGWGEASVRRFLARLADDALITMETDHGQLIITILGYDELQDPAHRTLLSSLSSDTKNDTSAEPPATQDRRSTDAEPAQDRRDTDAGPAQERRDSDANKNEGNQGNQGNERMGGGGAEPGFLDWWREYPVKHDQAAAERAWTQALRIASAATLIAGARRYASACAGRPSRYVKFPANWLQERCWLQAYPETLNHESRNDEFQPGPPRPNCGQNPFIGPLARTEMA